MNPRTIRAMDLWVGRPLCFALTQVRRVGRLLRGKPDWSQPVRKICFIKMIEQGATVLAHGAITRAIQMVGRENVYFWVFQENRAILDLLELVPVENVIVIRTSSLLRCLLDLLKTVWRIRKLRIDATVDMEFFARASAALAFLTGAKRRIGLHRFTSEGPYRGDLLTHRVMHNPYLHTAVAYGALVEALAANPDDLPLYKRPASALGVIGQNDKPTTYQAPPPLFVPTDQEKQAVRETIDRLAERHVERPIVLLNPNASDMLPLRKWPTERFVELGARLLAEDAWVTIGITGAPQEAAVAQKIAAAIVAKFQASPSPSATGKGGNGVTDLFSVPDPPPAASRCISFAGQTTLRELITLYGMSDVLVTNDSGPGHFAALTEIDSIVLFGPETPALFGPIGRHSHVLWAQLACSPCVNALNHRFSPCQNNVCMQDITVEQVLRVVMSVLRRRAAAVGRQRDVILPVVPVAEFVTAAVQPGDGQKNAGD